jgi:hypothetical protein
MHEPRQSISNASSGKGYNAAMGALLEEYGFGNALERHRSQVSVITGSGGAYRGAGCKGTGAPSRRGRRGLRCPAMRFPGLELPGASYEPSWPWRELWGFRFTPRKCPRTWGHCGRHHRLRVVALFKPAARHWHDARVFVGQIDLVLGLRTFERWNRWLAARLLARLFDLGLPRRLLGAMLGHLPLEALLGARFKLGAGPRPAK